MSTDASSTAPSPRPSPTLDAATQLLAGAGPSTPAPNVRVAGRDQSVRLSREVPHAKGAVLTIEYTPDHRIMIERPAALDGGIPEGPETYAWEGGVPSPEEPGAPHRGRYDVREERRLYDPMDCVAQLHATGGKLTKEQKADIAAAWDALWADLVEHLDDRAAMIANRFGLGAEEYTALANRPDLCDHLQIFPLAGPFFTAAMAQQIPAVGVKLDQAIAMMLSTPQQAVEKLGPGMMALGRRIPWVPGVLPQFSTVPEKRIAEQRAFVRKLLTLADKKQPDGSTKVLLDPNGVQKVLEDREWLLVTTCCASLTRAEFLPAILRDPAAAVKGVDTYLPPGMKVRTKRELLEKVFQTLADWRAANPADFQKAIANKTMFHKIIDQAKKWERPMAAFDSAATDRRAEEEAARVTPEMLLEERKRAVRMFEQYYGNNAYGRMRDNLDPASVFPDPPVLRVVEDDRWRMTFLPCVADVALESAVQQICVVSYCDRLLEGARGDRDYGSGWIFSLSPVGSPRPDGAQLVADLQDMMNGRRENFAYPQPGVRATIQLLRNGTVAQKYGRGNSRLDTPIAEWITAACEQVMTAERAYREQRRVLANPDNVEAAPRRLGRGV